jgi:hypothetical protein
MLSVLTFNIDGIATYITNMCDANTGGTVPFMLSPALRALTGLASYRKLIAAHSSSRKALGVHGA